MEDDIGNEKPAEDVEVKEVAEAGEAVDKSEKVMEDEVETITETEAEPSTTKLPEVNDQNGQSLFNAFPYSYHILSFYFAKTVEEEATTITISDEQSKEDIERITKKSSENFLLFEENVPKSLKKLIDTNVKADVKVRTIIEK